MTRWHRPAPPAPRPHRRSPNRSCARNNDAVLAAALREAGGMSRGHRLGRDSVRSYGPSSSVGSGVRTKAPGTGQRMRPKEKYFAPNPSAAALRLGNAGPIPTTGAFMRLRQHGPSRRSFVASGLAGGIALATRPVPAQSQDRSHPMETTIRAGNDIATQINIFSVEPENQPKLVQLLKDGTEGFFSKQPGWISTNLLGSK